MTLAVNGAPSSERSSVVGTFTAFTELGFAIGALSLGALASAVGYDGVFVVCAIGPLLGALLLSRLVVPRVTPGARRGIERSTLLRRRRLYARAAPCAAIRSRYHSKLPFGTRSSVG